MTGESALLIPVSGTATALFTLDCSPMLGLLVPALDTCTLKLLGCIAPTPDGGSVLPIYSSDGLQLMVFPNTTGGFILGADALQPIAGCTHFEIQTSNPQNSGARQFYLLQRTSL